MYVRGERALVCAAAVLWPAALLATAGPLLLFSSMGDVLVLTGAHVAAALTLLSGLLLLPAAVCMLRVLATGRTLSAGSRVCRCPLWAVLACAAVASVAGAAACAHGLAAARPAASLARAMQLYGAAPRQRRLVDTLQWALRCCGLDSYKDWFEYDWFERIRDSEWTPETARVQRRHAAVADSVPASCCRSGACAPHFLLELGGAGLHARGCGPALRRLLAAALALHLGFFLVLLVSEVTVLACILNKCGAAAGRGGPHDGEVRVQHIMAVNPGFMEASSASLCAHEDTEPTH